MYLPSNYLLNKLKNKLVGIRKNCTFVKKSVWKVLFFGTDEFSLYSLRALYKEYQNNSLIKKLEVTTTTKGKYNPVRKFAEKNQLVVHPWPSMSFDDDFHIGLVVSFGHLIPENIINKFDLGMINVHASLLPRWRGAAPIIYALAKGDTETGVTVMKIKPKHFDTGKIVSQKKIPINEDMTMPELHQRLRRLGADELVNCLHNLPESMNNLKPQPKEGITFAPKVTPDFATIKWEAMTSREIYNLERALIGFLPITTTWNGISVKLQEVKDCGCDLNLKDQPNILKPGFVLYDKKNKNLKVLCRGRTFLSVKTIGVLGKKYMSASDFNNGYVKKEKLENRFFK